MDSEQLKLLSRMHYRCGKLERALELLQQTLQVQERELGPHHVDLAVTLHAMAEIHCDQSNFNLAKPLYLRAMAIWHRSQPGDYLEWMAQANLLRKVQSSARCLCDSGDVPKFPSIESVA